MAILNYTTTVPAEQTIGEIQKMLSRYNVAAMMTEYDGKQVSAVSFRLNIDGRPMSFKLPCNWRGVAKLLKEHNETRGMRTTSYGGRVKKNKTDDSDEQSIRVAWRIIKDWIEAQLALVEVNMVTIPQIFLPYAMGADGRTLGEIINDDPELLLGDGKGRNA